MRKLILSIAFFAIFTITFGQSNQTQNTKTITVTGSAELEIVPDEIYAMIEIREYKKKGENKVQLEILKTEFLDKCKSIGIFDADITVASYEGSNLGYWYWKKRRRDPDLYASIVYEVKFTTAKKMDALIDILDDEATINFYVARATHSKITEFRKQLKIQAIKAAKDKAIYLAEAINEKASDAITIKEPRETDSDEVFNNNYSKGKYEAASNVYYEKKVGGVSNPSGNSINFKKIKLRYEVDVVFGIK
jgi:uncharacterized protein YggE